MSPLLGLVMIVKNEAASLEKTLRSVQSAIDCWTILDTGSTDGTQEIARRVLADLPGELQSGPFENYSQAFNLGLDLHAEKSTFALRLAGDETLEHATRLREFCERESRATQVFGAYDVRIKLANLTYVQPRLTRTAVRGRFRGRVHEWLDLPAGFDCGTVPEPVRIIHERPSRPAGDPSARLRQQRNWLELDMADEPENPRPVFYYAQTLQELGELDLARAAYLKRGQMGGWFEEAAAALFRAARLTADDTAPALLLRAWEMSPRQCEPLVALAEWLREKQLYRSAAIWARQACDREQPTDARLFVDVDAWRWKRWSELALAAWYTGQSQVGRQALETLRANLAADDPDWLWRHYRDTAAWYDQKYPLAGGASAAGD